MQHTRIAIVGAGGFAREVAWLISDIARDRAQQKIPETLEVVGFLVSDLAKVSERDSDLLGDFSWLETNHVDALAMGIGTPEVRLRLGQDLKRRFPRISWPALIHPSVRYDQSCHFAEGVVICAGNIATVSVRVDEFALVNLSCTIGHEATIGAGSVVNPLTAISGGVKIGKAVLVGTHVAILQYVSIGDHAVIGSGAMVNKDVAPNTTVMGVPAKSKDLPSPRVAATDAAPSPAHRVPPPCAAESSQLPPQ
jgi:sugar O-acyltransferase (sialic acid O-acetyltransferase NeuD family)